MTDMLEMPDGPDLAAVAALLGDATRAAMLASLMDGRAHTATELALAGGVTASTTSSHLSRLHQAGLVAITRQGRHRYFRLAAPEVAAAIEGLMGVAALAQPAAPRRTPVEPALARARTCYDHLAGAAGVRLLDRLLDRGLVRFLGAQGVVRGGVRAGDQGSELELTAAGEAWCPAVGIDLASLRAGRRRLCRGCLDWSERRLHLAGALGAALLDRLFALRYARRELAGRAVVLSPRGERFVEQLELAG